MKHVPSSLAVSVLVPAGTHQGYQTFSAVDVRDYQSAAIVINQAGTNNALDGSKARDIILQSSNDGSAFTNLTTVGTGGTISTAVFANQTVNVALDPDLAGSHIRCAVHVPGSGTQVASAVLIGEHKYRD